MSDKPRVLVVEDDTSWQHLYKEKLEHSEFGITIAGDLQTALTAINQRMYHVAVVDIRLDDADGDNVDGLRVLEKIWELDEGTEAIVVTGYAIDMFAQFRKLRMFGIEEKPWLTPEDLLQQSRSAAFVKNYYSKEEGIGAIVTKVNQAAQTVLRSSNKRRWADSPFNLVRGFAAAQIQRDLRVGQMAELRPFLGALCRPLHPWLKSLTDALPVVDGDGIDGFEFSVWSRSLGEPVLVRFGRKANRERFIAPSSLGYAQGVQIGELINTISTMHFVGSAFIARGMDFKENFELPVSKRTSRAVFIDH